MERRKDVLNGLIISLFILSSVACAGLKYVDSIDLDVGECYFFDNAAQQFELSTITGGSEVAIDVGNIHIAGGGWDYSFEGSIVVTASDLFYKNSTGQTAEAWFTNGSSMGTATVTIVATTLTDKLTNTQIFNPTTNPGGVVLLTALMNDADGYWQVKEYGDYEDWFYGNTHYAIDSGELVNGSLLRMLDFRAVWDLGSCSPYNISRFNQDIYSGTPSLELIPDGIPEPATLLLLALGGALCRRKK